MARRKIAATDWPQLARDGLAERPRLAAVLGHQLIERASQPDGLMNRLVRSLCGESLFADNWERLLAELPEAGRREYATLGVGSNFDQELESRLSELRAIDTFTSSLIRVDIEILPRRSRRTADFRATWMDTTAIVEVKRDRGLAEHLLLAESALSAARMLHPEADVPRVILFATDGYHQQRLEGTLDKTVEGRIAADLRELLDSESYAEFAAAVRSGGEASLSEGMLVAVIDPRPSQYGTGLAIQPYPSGVDRAVGTCMASLRGLASIAFQVRTALPQLAASGREFADAILVPYVHYDAWELDGLSLHTLAGIFSETLQWEPRMNVIVHLANDDRWFFGRRMTETMTAYERFFEWASYLAAQKGS